MNRKIRKSRLIKIAAVITLLSFLNELIIPVSLFAITGGPNSPEFSDFTPVTTTEMINMSTGDFNYNLPVIDIPGADGGGYSLSLSYSSGVNSEEEASWVGFGWTLNPGAINRNVRGFPDDYNGEEVDIYNKSRPNWTVSATQILGKPEVFGVDVDISLERSLRFNNFQGYQRSYGIGLNFKCISFGLDLEQGDGVTFNIEVNPISLINASTVKHYENRMNKIASKIDEKISAKKANKIDLKTNMLNEASKKSKSVSLLSTPRVGLRTFAGYNMSSVFSKINGFSFNIGISTQVNPSILNIGVQAGYDANFSMQFTDYYTTCKAYGYINSSFNGSIDNKMMDYYNEKESIYNKRDKFIGIPFSNYDLFMVTAEGLSGGFRAYTDRIGHYQPNRPSGGGGTFKILNAGFEVGAGFHLSVGLDLGAGFQTTKLANWGSYLNFGSTDSVHFRFNNDLGGQIDYCNDSTKVESANLYLENSIPMMKQVDLKESHLFYDSNRKILTTDKSGRASYIDYHTKGDIDAGRIFDPELSYFTFPDNLGEASIIEYSIIKPDGLNYVYGLPVFVKNETSLSIDINPDNHTIVDNYLAFRNFDLGVHDGGYAVKDNVIQSTDFKTVAGQIKKHPYAINHLLTSITTPDYVDLTNDGPTDDDFGGWTKFTYNKKYGSGTGNGWYRYRSPYNGFNYNKGDISVPTDNTGSFSTGEKEVYYLETIETSTHIAFFTTNLYEHNETKYPEYAVDDGSGNPRLDGLDAPTVSDTDSASNPANIARGNHELQYLEKIVLFAKNRPDKPLKVVCFDYDNSLISNLPNNINSNFNYKEQTSSTKENSGKLTLKRVWFEYEGTTPARISPYEFSYVYKQSHQVKTGKHLYEEYDTIGASLQKPSYSPQLLDPWGNVMPYGKDRNMKDIPWIYQGKYPPGDGLNSDDWRSNVSESQIPYDPAAWHLKQIKLPSGGEIHIQYEADDYQFVQDQRAMAMVSLIQHYDHLDEPEYYLNLNDIIINDESEESVDSLVAVIKDYYLGGDTAEVSSGLSTEKMYYKFLYALSGENPRLDNYLSEYITGYENVKKIETIPLEAGKYTVKITLGNGDYIPRRACFDLVKNQKLGKLNGSGVDDKFEAKWDNAVADAANRSQSDLPEGGSPDKSGAGAIKSGIALAAAEKMKGYSIGYSTKVNESQICKTINPNLSFLKIPILHAKRGGGVRVKRLLLYDNGLEFGDAAVYGKQYRYVSSDGRTSSGVATNEPQSAREENPIVKFLPRKHQPLANRLIAGEDKKRSEGPLGESIRPAASVIYSRVVEENIHTGKTGTGFTVYQYYTSKDYPVKRFYKGKRLYDNQLNENINVSDYEGTGVDYTNLSMVSDQMLLPTGIINMYSKKLWMAQGYLFVFNSMNGKYKSTTIYGGNYEIPDGINKKTDTQGRLLVKHQEDIYFEPGEKVPVLSWNSEEGTYTKKYIVPGKETEVAVEKKYLSDITNEFSVELDIGIGIMLFPPIAVTGIPSFTNKSKNIYIHSTSKIISYPAILKKQINYLDGVTTIQENIAFNESTGEPAIVSTLDGFNGLILGDNEEPHQGIFYSFNMPGEWIYSSMGQKAKNPSVNQNRLDISVAKFITYGSTEDAEPRPEWFGKTSGNMDLNINNLINLNIQTYKDNWSCWNDDKINDIYYCSDYASRLNNIWRPRSNYIYRGNPLVSTSNPEIKIYESGTYDISDNFNWSASDDVPQNNTWIKLSEITKYSPNGNPLEEIDNMQIYSSVLYTQQYGSKLPAMIVNNGEYNSIWFNDYENGNGDNTIAHSGKRSNRISDEEEIFNTIYVTKQLQDKGGIIKLWISGESNNTPIDELSLIVNSIPFALNKIAQTGEWILAECEIPKSFFASMTLNDPVGFSLKNNSALRLYIDDVKFQPKDAQSTCYVYDENSLRLLAQFDDQHFGIFYQYNDEGKLVRKLLETERGLKTIQETQYNVPKHER